MKRFKFKLERILSLRKHVERQWENKLAEATGKCVAIERQININLQRKAQEITDRFARRLSVQELIASHLFTTRLDIENEECEVELAERIREREVVQDGYLNASKERKVLDKLKERRAEENMRLQRSEDVKRIDDINMGRAARKSTII